MFTTENKIVQVPVLSGNSTRGNIRRLLAREYIDRFNIKELLGYGIFDKFYTALANGGNLEKNLDVAVDPDKRETEDQELRCTDTSGQTNIGFAILKCKELNTGGQRINDLLTDIGLVRHLEREQTLEAKPYTTECIIAGSEFELELAFAPQATDIEKSCLAHGFNLLKTVGGKSAVGFGRVEISGAEQDDTLYIDWLNNVGEEQLQEVKKFAEGL